MLAIFAALALAQAGGVSPAGILNSPGTSTNFSCIGSTCCFAWTAGEQLCVDGNGDVVTSPLSGGVAYQKGGVTTDGGVTAQGVADAITISGASAGNPVTVTATGTDAMVGLELVPKGSNGNVLVPNGVEYCLDPTCANGIFNDNGVAPLFAGTGAWTFNNGLLSGTSSLQIRLNYGAGTAAEFTGTGADFVDIFGGASAATIGTNAGTLNLESAATNDQVNLAINGSTYLGVTSSTSHVVSLINEDSNTASAIDLDIFGSTPLVLTGQGSTTVTLTIGNGTAAFSTGNSNLDFKPSTGQVNLGSNEASYLEAIGGASVATLQTNSGILDLSSAATNSEVDVSTGAADFIKILGGASGRGTEIESSADNLFVSAPSGVALAYNGNAGFSVGSGGSDYAVAYGGSIAAIGTNATVPLYLAGDTTAPTSANATIELSASGADFLIATGEASGGPLLTTNASNLNLSTAATTGDVIAGSNLAINEHLVANYNGASTHPTITLASCFGTTSNLHIYGTDSSMQLTWTNCSTTSCTSACGTGTGSPIITITPAENLSGPGIAGAAAMPNAAETATMISTMKPWWTWTGIKSELIATTAFTPTVGATNWLYVQIWDTDATQ